MLKYTENDITLDEVKIHYYRTGGKKPPIILLHGMSDNALCWTPFAEVLAPDYDVIMPDAQGHGLSDRLKPDSAPNQFSQQTAGLSLALGLTKPIVMGHSMGAGMAVQIAIDYPSLPRAIILEDPAWMTPPVDKNGAPVRPGSELPQYFSVLQKKTVKEILAEGRAANPAWSEAELAPWAESKLQFDASIFSRMTRHFDAYQKDVPQIKCATLLLFSDKGIVTQEVAKDAARLWTSKQPFKWVYIKGTGHNIRRENFKDYKAAVLDFLKSLPAK
jgi:N-formylmaleamate deformylase